MLRAAQSVRLVLAMRLLSVTALGFTWGSLGPKGCSCISSPVRVWVCIWMASTMPTLSYLPTLHPHHLHCHTNTHSRHIPTAHGSPYDVMFGSN